MKVKSRTLLLGVIAATITHFIFTSKIPTGVKISLSFTGGIGIGSLAQQEDVDRVQKLKAIEKISTHISSQYKAESYVTVVEILEMLEEFKLRN